MAGCGIQLCRFLIIAFLSTLLDWQREVAVEMTFCHVKSIDSSGKIFDEKNSSAI